MIVKCSYCSGDCEIVDPSVKHARIPKTPICTQCLYTRNMRALGVNPDDEEEEAPRHRRRRESFSG